MTDAPVRPAPDLPCDDAELPCPVYAALLARHRDLITINDDLCRDLAELLEQLPPVDAVP